jgi:hypothetical protein
MPSTPIGPVHRGRRFSPTYAGRLARKSNCWFRTQTDFGVLHEYTSERRKRQRAVTSLFSILSLVVDRVEGLPSAASAFSYAELAFPVASRRFDAASMLFRVTHSTLTISLSRCFNGGYRTRTEGFYLLTLSKNLFFPHRLSRSLSLSKCAAFL